MLKNVDPLGLDARVTTAGDTTTVESNFYLNNADGSEVTQAQVDAFQGSLDAVYKDRTITLADGSSHNVHFRLAVRAAGSGSVGPGDNTVTMTTRDPWARTEAGGSHMQLNLGGVVPVGFSTPAHETGHLLGLADLYSQEFDLSKVMTPDGKIDVTRDPSGMGGLTPISNAQGSGNLMGAYKNKTGQLADWQLEQIVGPSLAASRKNGGAQNTTILDAATRLEGATSAARRAEIESRNGCVLASAQCAARLSADEQRFLANETFLLKGKGDWDKHKSEIRRQLVESRKK